MNNAKEIYLLDVEILKGKTITFDSMVAICELKATGHIEECKNFWDLDIIVNDNGYLNKLKHYEEEGYDKLSLELISAQQAIDNIAENALVKADYSLCYIAEYMGIKLFITSKDSLAFVLKSLALERRTELEHSITSLKEKQLLEFKKDTLENTLVNYFKDNSKMQSKLMSLLLEDKKKRDNGLIQLTHF